MAYVPGCRYDLFISYARENNRDGWVDQFVSAIGQELSELLGRQFHPRDSVFFDSACLQTGNDLPRELANAARQSAVLVPLLSPSYLTSWWCDRERQEFLAQGPHGAEDSDCLAPVVVRPVEDAQLDAQFRRVLRASFLSTDGQTPLHVGSPEWTVAYRKLARGIKSALERLRRTCRPIFVGHGPEELRTWCQTELHRRQFRTTPDTLTELNDPDLVRASLQEALLAIHFLGGAESQTFEAIEASTTLCAGATILYQPFGSQLTADERIWLGDFERDLQTKPGLYQRLAGKNRQELFSLIDDQVSRRPAAGIVPDAQPQLAFVCEAGDLVDVRRLQLEIQKLTSLDIALPDFLSERHRAMERLRKWHDFLVRGQAQLFYYGATELDRLESIWQKAEQQKPDLKRNWYLGPPDLDTKLQSRPEALWQLEQVIQFLRRENAANAS